MPNPPAVTPGADVLAEWGNDVVARVIPIFADEATRNSQHLSPEAGQVAFTVNNSLLWIYSGTAWVTVHTNLLLIQNDNGVVVRNPTASVTLQDSVGQPATNRWAFTRTAYGAAIHNVATGIDQLQLHVDGTLELRGAANLDVFRSWINALGDTVIIAKAIEQATTASPANVHIEGSGALLKSTSTAAGKTGVSPLSAGDMIDRLAPVTFASTAHADDPDHRYAGFIAEDVAAAFPEADAGDNYDLRALVALLVAEVKQLRSRVAALEGAAV